MAKRLDDDVNGGGRDPDGLGLGADGDPEEDADLLEDDEFDGELGEDGIEEDGLEDDEVGDDEDDGGDDILGAARKDDL